MAHDVITDHDLHAEGVAALAPYRVVIAAQHPEYHSERMMQAFEDFLGQGGRLMYLGGNGFYWRAEPSQDQPDTLEVRRAEGGIRTWETSRARATMRSTAAMAGCGGASAGRAIVLSASASPPRAAISASRIASLMASTIRVSHS